MTDYTIIVNKASFAVYYSTPSKKGLLTEFARRFNTYTYVYDYKQKKKVRKTDKTYVGGNHHHHEFIFNITFVKDFMWMLRKYNIDKDSVEIIVAPEFKKNPLGINFRYDEYELRDYQDEVQEQVKNFEKKFSFLIDHQTGKGKGIMSISSICEINKTVFILILPKYIKKWIKELKETTDATDEDIVVIQGGRDLISYMEMASSGEWKPKIIIMSARTNSNYLRDYEQCEDLEEEFMYPVIPGNLMETFGVGVIMIDETHREFYSVFNSSLYYNVDLILGMSATLISDDASKEKYYQSLFPNEVRLSNMDLDRYTHLHEVRYDIENFKRITCVSNMGYSHISFEQSIMRHNQQLKNYVDMLKFYVDKSYLKRRKEGHRMILFCASIDLCTLMTYTLKEMCPTLKVSRYVEDDQFEVILNSDIIVTTVLSSGEAFDIPGLISVVQSISMKSPASNIQALGRLRDLKGLQMEYWQLYSRNIPKQNDYHKYRLELFKPRVKAIFLEEYKFKI